MIPFFRRLRKKLSDDNKTLKYLRYAIGEIVLVVIGILIALSINNWNEDRLAMIREKEYVLSIYKDLQNDIRNIETNTQKLVNQYSIGIEVLTALENKLKVPLDSAKITHNLGWDLSNVIPAERDENTWDGLKVKGTETRIINDSLIRLLNRFYADYDAQIDRFNQLPKKIRQDLRELTGLCNDAEGIQAINANGLAYYGISSGQMRHCVLSKEEVPNLVGVICMSCIVNIKIYHDLKDTAAIVRYYMEEHFEFL